MENQIVQNPQSGEEIEVGCFLLKKAVEEFNNDPNSSNEELTYQGFKNYLRSHIPGNILLIRYLGIENSKTLLQNIRAFSENLTLGGWVAFHPESNTLSLTHAGCELADKFIPFVDKSANDYLNYCIHEAEKVLNANSIVFNEIEMVKNFEQNNVVTVESNQHFSLLQTVFGRRFVIVYGIGTFKLDDYNDAYRPYIHTIQTIVK